VINEQGKGKNTRYQLVWAEGDGTPVETNEWIPRTEVSNNLIIEWEDSKVEIRRNKKKHCVEGKAGSSS